MYHILLYSQHNWLGFHPLYHPKQAEAVFSLLYCFHITSPKLLFVTESPKTSLAWILGRSKSISKSLLAAMIFNISSVAHRQGYRVTSLHMGNGWVTLQPCLCAAKSPWVCLHTQKKSVKLLMVQKPGLRLVVYLPLFTRFQKHPRRYRISTKGTNKKQTTQVWQAREAQKLSYTPWSSSQ